MSLFNSLGSNYKGGFVIRSMFPFSGKSRANLQQLLKLNYSASDVVLTNKCREAITLILRNQNFPAGSLVAISGYTCYVVYAAVEAAGLQPLLVDIPEDKLNFTAEGLQSALTKNTNIKAVIVQNTLGIPAPIEQIKQICEQKDLFLIEDLAHSAGLVYESGQMAGCVGNATALSFSQDKIIDAVSGGAAITRAGNINNPNHQSLKTWGKAQLYWYPLNTLIIRATHRTGLGKLWLKVAKSMKLLPNQMAGDPKVVNNIPNHQAGMAVRALSNLQNTNLHRQKIATIYQNLISQDLQLPYQKNSVYIRFPLLVDRPHELEKYLRKFQIFIANPWYDAVIAPKRYLTLTSYAKGQCPNAEYVAEHMVNLPTHINITEDDAKLICSKINEWHKASSGSETNG